MNDLLTALQEHNRADLLDKRTIRQGRRLILDGGHYQPLMPRKRWSWIHWRIACPTFLRRTFVEWTASTIPRSFWAGAYYQQQSSKGCSHRVAVRALAFKWIRIIYRCWKTRTPYDESVYLKALRNRGSPLLANVSESTKMT